MTRQVNRLSEKEGQDRLEGDEDSCRFLRAKIRSCHRLANEMNNNCGKCTQRYGATDTRQKVLKPKFDEQWSEENPVSLIILHNGCMLVICLTRYFSE